MTNVVICQTVTTLLRRVFCFAFFSFCLLWRISKRHLLARIDQQLCVVLAITSTNLKKNVLKPQIKSQSVTVTDIEHVLA